MIDEAQKRREEATGSKGIRHLHPYGAVKYTWEAFVYENPNWEQTLLELAQEGEGKTAWMVYLGLNWRTFKRFLEQEEFSDAIEKAELLELLYWEREGRRMVSGDSTKLPGAGKGNAFVFALIMKNKFGWDAKGSTQDPLALSISSSQQAANSPNELTEEELTKELLARGLPVDILSSYTPEPVNYESEQTIDGQYTEVNE